MHQGHFQQALDIFERLYCSLPSGTAPHSIPWLLKLKGEALTGLGQPEEARSVLETALEGAKACQIRPLEWKLEPGWPACWLN